MKYFFIQSLASLLILVGLLFPFFVGLFESYYIVVLALFIKLGAAPFHIWFPSVIEGLDWGASFFLLTWQKLAPLLLIGGFDFIQIVVICSVLVGSLGGFNQTSLKKILAYSSIMHIGWMLGGMGLAFSFGLKYYLVYVFFSSVLVWIFSLWSTLRLSHLLSSFFVVSFSVLILLLSMGGFPPMLGFFPKWYIIVELLSSNVFLSFFLVFSSLLNLFFYFRLFYAVLFLGFPAFYSVGLYSKDYFVLGIWLSVSLVGGLFYPSLFLYKH